MIITWGCLKKGGQLVDKGISIMNIRRSHWVDNEKPFTEKEIFILKPLLGI